MESLEVDPNYSFICSNGQVAQQPSDVFTTPSKTTAQGQTLRLSLELDLGIPIDHWCADPNIPLASWAASFKAIAISKNGLSATAQLILQSP